MNKPLSFGQIVLVIGGFILLVCLIGIGTSNSNNASTNATTTDANVPPSAPTVTQSETQFGDGTYIVNTEIQPGTYASTGGSNCYYKRLSGFGGTIGDIIANEDTHASAIVTIASTDKGFQSSGCGMWTKISIQKSTSSTTENVSNKTPVLTIKNDPINQSISPASSPQNVVSPSINWNSFVSVDFATYHNDPGAYQGSNVMVAAISDGIFLPSIGNGVISNYIEIGDPTETTLPKLEISIPDQGNYSSAVFHLEGGNLYPIRIYGTGSSPQEFTMTNGAELAVPVITARRIDFCPSGYGDSQLTVVYGQTKLSDIINECPSWQTIFPSGNFSSASTDGASSNPRYFQVTVTGSCGYYNGDGTVILNGYPYTDGYAIPSSNISTWSNNVVAFTVPSTVTAGTYQVTIRGYQPGVGYCPDVNGGNITIQ